MARPLRTLSLATSLAAAATALCAIPSAADAQRIRVRGGVRVHAHGHVYIGPRRVRRVRYVPPVYVGVRYAEPPPPPCYDCDGYYYQEPAPAVTVAAPMPEPPPPVPTFGLGIFAGGIAVDGQDAGDELGLVARLRLSHHLRLEGELSKTEHDNATRVDRRMGLSLLYDLAPYSKLSPYLLGGLGMGKTELEGGMVTANTGYGELGIGLEWRLARNFSLVGDIRAGQREHDVRDERVYLIADEPMDDEEDYTRGRIGAILFF